MNSEKRAYSRNVPKTVFFRVIWVWRIRWWCWLGARTSLLRNNYVMSPKSPNEHSLDQELRKKNRLRKLEKIENIVKMVKINPKKRSFFLELLSFQVCPEWIMIFRMSIVSTRKPQEASFKFILFPEKLIFQRKFMVFLKIFFAQKKEQKKLHRVVPTIFI